jgi:hypothetical protein
MTTLRSTCRTIRHTKQTGPQREFWASTTKFRLYSGGVGSGKTRAGVIEAFRQPPGSTGTILAPTYPMLRDATLRTFLELADQARVLRSFHKEEMTAVLGGNRTVMFRSADRPNTLRGPNLGWFWPDEAAMMPELVWKIMIARLRCEPGIAWCTTTPRGKDWLWKKFVDAPSPSYTCIRASSRTNPFLPADFIAELVDAYDAQFALQEIEGDFLDDAFGQLLPDAWIDRLPTLVRPAKPGGPRWISCDLGEGAGRDSTAILAGDDLGILWGELSPWVGKVEAARRIHELALTWDVRQDRIVYDAGGGRGLDIEPFLEQHGITEAIPYKGSKDGGATFLNRRSKMAWLLRQRLDPEKPKPPPPLVYDPARPPSPFDAEAVRPIELQAPFTLPADCPWWPRLREELQSLKYCHKGKKIALEPKEELAARLRRSPDILDALLMRFQLGEDA